MPTPAPAVRPSHAQSPGDDLARKAHAAFVRARWFVLQTGLITTGLALFGVYVLANRINDMHVMTLYVLHYLPAGPLLIGVIAASGYALGAWWAGVRVRGGLLATILLLQLAAYLTAQYTEFASLNLRYPDTGADVEFSTYFHHTTLVLPSYLREGSARDLSQWGYGFRAAEAVLFASGGLASALILVGQPRCPICRGLLQERRLATVSSSAASDVLPRLAELARVGDTSRFERAVRLYDEGDDAPPADDPAVDLLIHRCKACGHAYVEVRAGGKDHFAAALPSKTEVKSDFAADLFKPPPPRGRTT